MATDDLLADASWVRSQASEKETEVGGSWSKAVVDAIIALAVILVVA